MVSYYTYGDYAPATCQNPGAGYWETAANWPQSYCYISAYDSYYQGLHPPAPVYQQTSAAQPQMYYYNQASTAAPAGFMAANGIYYPSNPQAPTGWAYYSPSPYTSYPYTYSSQPSYSTNWYYYPTTAQYPYNYSTAAQYPAPYLAQYPYNYSTTAQYPYNFVSPQFQQTASTVLAANAALAAQPSAPYMYVGKDQTEIDMQNAIFAATYPNMTPVMTTQQGMPSQIVPYKPAATQQFWCKELEGTWTLREQAEMMRGELNPGHWEKHATSGYFYWVRHSA